MRSAVRFLGPPLLISGVVLSGCEGGPGDAAAPLEIASAAALPGSAGDKCDDDGAGQHDGRFAKRCHHYKQHGRPPCSQSGQVKLTTRALMDVNHVTLVEATTGTFDDGSVPPGWFDDVKIRSAKLRKNFNLDKDGDDNDFDSLQGKSGYFSVAFPTPAPSTTNGKGNGNGKNNKSLPMLLHGQPLRITASVRGIVPGNAVVRVDDQVKYRPDLSVARLDAPAATVGLPASITATVHERMGDTGALADCVLSVDGTASDFARNIWVDAGGTVTCQFAHTFAAAGAHALHVDVGNVRPGDYDMSNNGADATINVASGFKFSGWALDGAYTSTYQEQVLDADSNVLFEQNTTQTGSNDAISISGTWQQAVAFPLASTSVNASSAGSSWSIFAANGFPGVLQDDGSTCASGPDATGTNWVIVCSSTSGAPVTQVTVTSFSGDVTYHSDMSCRQTSSFYDCAGGYTWNSDGSSTNGVRHILSDALTAQIAMTDAAGTSLTGTTVIPVTAYSIVQDQPLVCSSGGDGARDCVAQHYDESGTKGSAAQ